MSFTKPISTANSKGKGLSLRIVPPHDKYDLKLQVDVYTFDESNRSTGSVTAFVDLDEAFHLAHILSIGPIFSGSLFIHEVKKTSKFTRILDIKRYAGEKVSGIAWTVKNGESQISIVTSEAKAQAIGMKLKLILEEYIRDTAPSYFMESDQRQSQVGAQHELIDIDLLELEAI